MLSRIVAPVSCQPMPHGLPPDTVMLAEPLPPQGRNGGLESQVGTDWLSTLATCVSPGFRVSGPLFGGGAVIAPCWGAAGSQKSDVVVQLWPATSVQVVCPPAVVHLPLFMTPVDVGDWGGD